jgi:hypothetical protein
MQLPLHIVGVFVTPPFFPKKKVGPWFNPDSYPPFFDVPPKKEVGPWFNPDSYRDRLGSKNLPIGGFFAFYAPFFKVLAISMFFAFLISPPFFPKKRSRSLVQSR